MLCNHVTRSGLISAIVHDGEVDPELTFFYEAWLHLHEHVSSKNNWYWTSGECGHVQGHCFQHIV
jgi:predicted outer membrane protein